MLPDLTLKNFKHVGTLLAEKEYVWEIKWVKILSWIMMTKKIMTKTSVDLINEITSADLTIDLILKSKV